MYTDIIFFACCCLGAWRGFCRGFWVSVAGPVGMIVATFAAFQIFNSSGNIPLALAVGLIGPFIIAWGIRIVISLIRKKDDSKKTLGTNFLGNVAGASITTLASFVFTLPIILMLGLIPPEITPLKSISDDVRSSRSYSAIKNIVIPKKPGKAREARRITIEEIQNDERMQDLMNDPAVKEAIESKDYKFLMTNPKIMKLTQDSEFIKKLFTAYAQLQEEKKTGK